LRPDCDGGGIDNATECASGGNPTNPGDDMLGDCDCVGGICATNQGFISGTAGDPLDGSAAPYILPPNCLLVDNAEATAHRGFMYACTPGLAPSSVCTDVPNFATPPTPPVFTCPSEAIEYSLPVTEGVYMQYWSNCATGVSGLPVITAANQGFVNQLFCDTDGFGYPLAPTNAGTPLAGIVSQVPARSTLASDMAAEIDPATTCAGNNGELELIQMDFWMLIPDYITDVGVQLNGPGVDAALIMIGSGLSDLSPIAEIIDGAAGQEGTPTGYYCLPATTPACAGQYLRFRIYITDIGGAFNVSPAAAL